MASIFAGVPFIVDLPGRRPPENHAANLAVGAQIGIANRRAMQEDRRAGQEDRRLNMEEDFKRAMGQRQEAQSKLLESRLAFMADEANDMALMNEWLPKLYQDPDQVETPPFRTLNALEQFEKSRALTEQRKLGISRVQIAQGIEKEIHSLPDRGEAARLLGVMFRTGISDDLINQLRQAQAATGLVEGLTPSANTAIFAEKMRVQAEQLRGIGDNPAADRMDRVADRIESSATQNDAGNKARLDLARAEFEAATKDLSPDSPIWIESRNKYLREVEGITGQGSQNNAARFLEGLGVTQDALKAAAERWKANQGP